MFAASNSRPTIRAYSSNFGETGGRIQTGVNIDAKQSQHCARQLMQSCTLSQMSLSRYCNNRIGQENNLKCMTTMGQLAGFEDLKAQVQQMLATSYTCYRTETGASSTTKGSPEGSTYLALVQELDYAHPIVENVDAPTRDPPPHQLEHK